MNIFLLRWIFLLSLYLPFARVSNASRVLELGDKFLDVYKQDHNRMWLVKFYAPWCHYCKQMEKAYAKVAQILYNDNVPVHVGRLDCTRFANVAGHFSVKGFPTILFITSRKSVEFLGDRNTLEIVDFAKRLAG